MDAIRISKPNMSALRQSPAALSPFGMFTEHLITGFIGMIFSLIGCRVM